MKILITALYVSGDAHEGGSSRFFKTLADALILAGHDVVCSDRPEEHVDLEYDLIICSHVLEKIRDNPAFKIFIAHGIILQERMKLGADRYISISEEAQSVNSAFDIESEVVPQPIKVTKRTHPGEGLKRILIIRREPVLHDPFEFLNEKYDVRLSDIDSPIEDQIAWADLCITLGRGALESMAQGKPVLIADNRSYIGAVGDGYVNEDNIKEIAKCNFSGRRFAHPITREWVESELSKYSAKDSFLLFRYVQDYHNVNIVIGQYLNGNTRKKIDRSQEVVAFGVLVNDIQRLEAVFAQSAIDPSINAHTIKMPETACKGLNKLLTIMEDEGDDIAVLAHQDMYFRAGWLSQMKRQIALLPDSWVVAGIIGKDWDGAICGRVHDMRIPLHFSTSHAFPHPASCFDECCIIVNLKKGFRFDEEMPGFDLYGTLAVLQTVCEMNGTAWMIDAFAEHYCMRSFEWYPDKKFESCFRWLYEKFPNARRIDTTVMGVEREKKVA